MLPLEYIAAATGRATSPTTPSFLWVCSETTFCCMLYVLIVIVLCKGTVVLETDLTFLNRFVQLLVWATHRTVQFLNCRAWFYNEIISHCMEIAMFFSDFIWFSKKISDMSWDSFPQTYSSWCAIVSTCWFQIFLFPLCPFSKPFLLIPNYQSYLILF